MAISSTVAASESGKELRCDLVPDGVVQYIRKYGLYRMAVGVGDVDDSEWPEQST